MTRRKYDPPPFPRPTPPRKVRDPYLFVLICQAALCLLILLGALALREAKPKLWDSLKPRYEQLLMSADALKGEFDRLTEEAMAAAERFANVVAERASAKEDFAPSEPARLPTVSADSETPVLDPASSEPWEGVQVGLALPTMANMVGMGGSGTPDNCTFAPVLLTAPLEPPIGGRVTSGYGWREHPITGNDDFHRGIDIAGARGSAIHAVLPGVVAEIGESAIYGNYIRMDHGHGLQTAYSHCETIVARQGENLRKGELLATVGSTGVSTGPHVHFEILMNGMYYDPAWVTSGLTEYGD